MSKSSKRFTIITVVFNDVKNIEKTIQSVLQQTLKDYEYIVVDGGSNDGTLEVVNTHSGRIDRIISEKDNGIYDAMNKGVLLAKGEWILFLNSGDLLFNSDVLSKLDQLIDRLPYPPAVVYGDVEVLIPKQQIRKVVKAKTLESIELTMPFNHQSTLVNAQIHKSNLYNLDYRIVADYDLFLRLYLKGQKFLNVGFTISSILAGGLSDSGRNKTFLEKRRVHDVYFPNRNNALLYYGSVFRFYLSSYFKRLAPKMLVRKIYQKKYK